MRIFSRWILCLPVLAAFLSGCGGNNDTVGATVRPLFQVTWPGLSRALTPLDSLQSARSVKITIVGAVDPGTPLISGGSGRTDAVAVVNRDPSRTDRYDGLYKLPNDVRTGSYDVVAEFYAQENAVGTVVARGETRAEIEDIGRDGEVAFARFIPASNLQSNLQDLAIRPNQTIRVGQIKALDIGLSVKPGVTHTVVAFRPGSIELTINGDGTRYLEKVTTPASFDVSQEETKPIDTNTMAPRITAAAGDLRVLAIRAGDNDAEVPVSVTVRIDNQSIAGTVTVQPSGLSVSVAPSGPVEVEQGGTFQFTAAVAGPQGEDFSNVVRWSLGDDATTRKHLASVSGVFTGNPITFQAADAAPGARFRLTATSVQPAQITNPPASPPIDIVIVPRREAQIQFVAPPPNDDGGPSSPWVELPASRRGSDGNIYTRTQQFQARLVGPGNPIPQVEWNTVPPRETEDPDPVLGGITREGLYTVPSQPGVYELRATSITSVEGERKSRSIYVRVVAGDADIVIQ